MSGDLGLWMFPALLAALFLGVPIAFIVGWAIGWVTRGS